MVRIGRRLWATVALSVLLANMSMPATYPQEIPPIEPPVLPNLPQPTTPVAIPEGPTGTFPNLNLQLPGGVPTGPPTTFIPNITPVDQNLLNLPTVNTMGDLAPMTPNSLLQVLTIGPSQLNSVVPGLPEDAPPDSNQNAANPADDLIAKLLNELARTQEPWIWSTVDQQNLGGERPAEPPPGLNIEKPEDSDSDASSEPSGSTNGGRTSIEDLIGLLRSHLTQQTDLPGPVTSTVGTTFRFADGLTFTSDGGQALSVDDTDVWSGGPGNDSVVQVTFHLPKEAFENGTPKISFTDPTTGQMVEVQGSSSLSTRVNAELGTITMVFDRTSNPTPSKLFGWSFRSPFFPQMEGAILIASLPPDKRQISSVSAFDATVDDTTPRRLQLRVNQLKARSDAILLERPQSTLFYTATSECRLPDPGRKDVSYLAGRDSLIGYIPDGRQYKLLKGTMLVSTAGTPAVVSTGLEKISIPAQSTILVSAPDGSNTSVSVLAEPAPVKQASGAVTVEPRNENPFTVAVLRTASILHLVKAARRFCITAPGGKRYQATGTTRRESPIDPAALKKALDGNPFLARIVHNAYAIGTSGAPRIVRHASCGSFRTANRIICARGTLLGLSGSSLQLFNGNIFVEAESRMTLLTPVSKINHKKGGLSEVSYSLSRKTNRVAALSGTDDVSVQVHDRLYSLSLGEELIAAAHRMTQSEAVPPDGVARRCFRVKQLCDNYTVAVCDFSIPSALGRAKYFKSMHNGSRHDTRIRNQLIKSASVAAVALSKRGPYYAYR